MGRLNHRDSRWMCDTKKSFEFYLRSSFLGRCVLESSQWCSFIYCIPTIIRFSFLLFVEGLGQQEGYWSSFILDSPWTSLQSSTGRLIGSKYQSDECIGNIYWNSFAAKTRSGASSFIGPLSHLASVDGIFGNTFKIYSFFLPYSNRLRWRFSPLRTGGLHLKYSFSTFGPWLDHSSATREILRK